MKTLFIAAFVGAASVISTALPAHAQLRLCFTVGDLSDSPGLNVYAGDSFNLTTDGSGEPSYVTGEVIGSRVNVRLGAGTEYESDGSYGVVGDYVTALRWGYDQNCDEWYLVRFPQSNYVGWIKGTFIQFVYGRGLFD